MARPRPINKRRRGRHVAVGDGDALLIIDVINDLNFPGGERVLPWAEKLAPRLSAVRGRFRRAGLPVIYANDNFGLWRSDLFEVCQHCRRRSSRGAGVVRRLRPGRDDYSVLKPRHSAFYATPLEPLLEDLQAKRIVLAGIATNLCVLFTAHDAHMRKLRLIVLSDCCAAESNFDHDVALTQLEKFCGARICRSDELRIRAAHPSQTMVPAGHAGKRSSTSR